MAKKPMHGNYLTLENVRVTYDEKFDSIFLTSKDKHLPKGKGFNLTLNSGRETELTLREMLESFGMMPTSKNILIPKTLNFATNVLNSGNPHMISLGRINGSKEIYWDVDVNPHFY